MARIGDLMSMDMLLLIYLLLILTKVEIYYYLVTKCNLLCYCLFQIFLPHVGCEHSIHMNTIIKSHIRCPYLISSMSAGHL